MSEIASSVRDFLRQAVEASGLTAARLAKKANVAPSTITRFLNDPDYPHVPKATTLGKIATAAGIALPGEIALGAPARSEPMATMLPVVGQVAAGMWAAVEEMDQDEPKYLPAARDPRFPSAQQYLLEVRGDSMNALVMNGRPAAIFDGDLVHLVSITDIGYVPQTGDVIEFERVRDGGHLREVTLKQVEVTQDGVLLWPRSTNARWKDPVRVDDGAKLNEEIEGRIRGLVLAVMRRFGV